VPAASRSSPLPTRPRCCSRRSTPPAAPAAPRPDLDLSDPKVATIYSVIEQQINPSIAAHGGRATLIDIQDDRVFVELGGGCQGCSMASVTLKQGVERLIKQAVPSVREVVDTTDHAGGTNPYFSAAKGGAGSPFASSKG
jgi:Fe-S cluster biogenesis protein NfuA